MPEGTGNVFQFERAVRRQTWAVFGLAGPSGGGKTWTALELATGLAGNGRIALISTEGTRDLYYADHFDFDRVSLEAPYTPDRCLEAMKAAQEAGYRVVIFDSFSDEYIGEGGLADMAEAERAKMRTPNEAAKWAKPKAAHKKVIRWIRNSARCHLIFAMRAEEKVKLVKVTKDGKEQTVVEPIGYQPIAEKSFMYDMMESALLLPDMRDKEGKTTMADARGVPQWIKPMSQHLAFFPDRKPITREAGRLLAQWCAGGAPAPPPLQSDLLERAEQEADKGYAALEAYWHTLSKADKRRLKPELDSLKQRATDADTETNQADDDDPFGLPSTNEPAPAPAATEPLPTGSLLDMEESLTAGKQQP